MAYMSEEEAREKKRQKERKLSQPVPVDKDPRKPCIMGMRTMIGEFLVCNGKPL